jgi:hypothetical protein
VVDDGRQKFPRLVALSAVRDSRGLSKAEKLILFTLISHAGSDGTCFPSYETLAEECDMGRGRVAEAIGTLLARTDGPIKLVRAHRARTDGSGGRSSNMYRLQLSPAGGRNPGVVESAEGTQPGEGLSLEIEGVESPNAGGVESRPGTGSSPMKLSNEAHQDLATDKPSQTSAPEFALEAPKQEAKRGKRRPKESEPNPDVNVLREHHRSEHLRVLGVEPVYTSGQHARAGKAWKELLSVRAVDVAKTIITAALEDRFAVDPWTIVTQQNKFASGKPRARGRGYQPQDGSAELLTLGRRTRAGDLLPDQLARIREQEARELEEALS